MVVSFFRNNSENYDISLYLNFLPAKDSRYLLPHLSLTFLPMKKLYISPRSCIFCFTIKCNRYHIAQEMDQYLFLNTPLILTDFHRNLEWESNVCKNFFEFNGVFNNPFFIWGNFIKFKCADLWQYSMNDNMNNSIVHK